ncbi:CoA ester lyase [Novosphingobium sp. ZN18A2]|uniref:HpcH/HpaI aldolase/citrate lyase family protein n=1 Tax=Novosphingobium sp. ZN18A2 TaxID=3079861 RepID=UPI0030D0E341
MKNADSRPLRSVLYMPASNARAIDKARGLDADALVFDLEDAVAPDAKVDARAQLCSELSRGGFSYRRLVARMNGLDTPWGRADMAALAHAPVEALLAPKIDREDDIAALSLEMDRLGFAPDAALWVMIETPAAVLAIERIAAMAATTRLAGFVLGLNDLAKDTGMAQTPGREAFVPVMVGAMLAARANGLVVIDGVCNAIDDAARLEGEARQAREFGFDGKSLIHPAQIAPVNAVFAPSDSEISQAMAIVAAFDAPENRGKGAIRVDGKMVELLHLAQARQVIATADAIASR